MKDEILIQTVRCRVCYDDSISISTEDDGTWLYAGIVTLSKCLSYSARFLFYRMHLEWEKNNRTLFPRDYYKLLTKVKLDLSSAMDELLKVEIVKASGTDVELNEDYCWHSEHGNLYESGAEITFKVKSKE